MANNKYQVIALMGESGAGKDTIQNFNCKKHPFIFHKIVSCTTRPQRDYETNGDDYWFITVGEFARKLLKNEMLEATEYKTEWFYGTPISSLCEDKINIGVFNPDGVRALLSDDRLNVLVIKIEANDKMRLVRCLVREDDPDCSEICRRFLADKKDFSDLEFEYETIYNNDDSQTDFFHPNIEGLNLEVIKALWKNLEERGSITFDAIMRWDTTASSDTIAANKTPSEDKID